MPKTIIIDEGQGLAEEELDRVIETLEFGGLIVYPTTTLYGLGALVFSEEGVARLMEAKKRPWGMPVSVFTLRDRLSDICDIPVRGLPILNSNLPLTHVLPAKPNVSSVITQAGSLAVRFPDNDLIRAICEKAGPITATSANIHGGSDPIDIHIARDELGELVDIYIDAGRCQHGTGTTIVDLTGTEVRIIREGIIPREQVIDLYG